MKCLLCFLSDAHQYEVKQQAQLGQNRFENTLQKYKNLFLADLEATCSVDECDCNHQQFSNEIKEYISKIRMDIISKKNDICSFFDEVFNIYYAFVSQNHIAAYRKLKQYMDQRCLNQSVSGIHGFCKPLFRVRMKPSKDDNYDPHSVNEYYHIPFSKRYLVGNQRYSISGLPMIYLADNLQTALDEVEAPLENVNVAVYIPIFSDFYKSGIFDATNYMFENITAIILENININSLPDYSSKFDNGFIRNMSKHLAEYILYQILQYQTNKKGKFVEQYVLPQLITELVQNESKWIGIKYQSTKSACQYADVLDVEAFYNYCFVIPYNSYEDYNEEYKSNFIIALSVNSTEINETIFAQKRDDCMNLCKKNHENGCVMTDYIVYINSIDSLIKSEKKRVSNGTLDQNVLQCEINLLYQLLLKIEKILLNPQNHAFVRRS